ncbi:transporter substrate-binding domain-containing protein [Candidatus Bipolaricaulota bacterium]|nr:transporter substrate-binding domain-containing protein [Candidatus Bipolaricaulota bacterium]
MRAGFRAVAVATALLVVLSVVGGLAQETYIVASDIPWAPFEMITDGGEFFGFDLDLMRAVAITAGFEVEIQNIAFAAIIETVRTGRADIGASGFTINPERDANVDFSDPYYLSNQAVVIQKGSDLNIVTALAGMGPNGAVGAQDGTTGLWWVEALQESGVSVDLRAYETYPTAILDLVNGRIDAVVQDEPASVASISSYPDLLAVAGIINTNEYFGFLVREGDPEGLLPRINAALGTLGLTILDGPGGMQELVVEEGSAIDDLLAIYFGPDTEDIEAAWVECKALILGGDLEGFLDCMKQHLSL